MTDTHAIVLGAGSWGTALAQLLASNGHDVTLWMRDAALVETINVTRENAKYLPDALLHPKITATAKTPNFDRADLCLSVIPAQYTRAQLEVFAPAIPKDLPIILCSKGIEIATLDFMNEVLAEAVPQASRFVLLGMGLGQSAHAALIARGFAEMNRLGAALGAQSETLSGLCGLGDLVLTCSSTQSRNMSCGMKLGQGETLADILAQRNSVTEGVATAPALVRLAQAHGVDMPISLAVNRVLAGEISPPQAMTALLSRPLKSEVY